MIQYLNAKCVKARYNERVGAGTARVGKRQLRGGNGQSIVSDKSYDITDSMWKWQTAFVILILFEILIPF